MILLPYKRRGAFVQVSCRADTEIRKPSTLPVTVVICLLLADRCSPTGARRGGQTTGEPRAVTSVIAEQAPQVLPPPTDRGLSTARYALHVSAAVDRHALRGAPSIGRFPLRGALSDPACDLACHDVVNALSSHSGQSHFVRSAGRRPNAAGPGCSCGSNPSYSSGQKSHLHDLGLPRAQPAPHSSRRLLLSYLR
jgi:hypothetical protein